MQATDRSTLTLRRLGGVMAALLLASAASLAQNPAVSTKVIVEDVRLGGGHAAVPAQRIFGLLKTRPGAEFSQEVVDDDIRRLMETKQFRNVSATKQDQPNGKVIVYFICIEYPTTISEIVYKGAKHLKEDELNTLTGLRKGMVLNPRANLLACQAIAAKYNESGRLFSTVDLVEGGNPGDTRVVFNITEGPEVKVHRVHIAGGPAFVSEAVLKTHVNTSGMFLGLIGGKYVPAMVDEDIHKLEDYYRSYGFLDIRVSREITRLDERSVDITFHVHEGLRSRFKETPQVFVNGKEAPADLTRVIGVKAGEFYDEHKIDGDKKKLSDYRGAQGYDAKVITQPTYFDPGLVQVNYQLEERAPAYVGNIIISGNEVTRQTRILSQIPLYPGGILSYPDLRVGEGNLARMNIFEMDPEKGIRPTIEVLDREGDARFKDILVNVQETRTGSLLFGVGVNSDAGLTGSIVLNERNFDILRFPTSFEDLVSGRAFRGNAQELRLEAVPGTQVQRYMATWRDPAILDSPYSLGISGYYFDRQYDEYQESRLGTRITVGRQLKELNEHLSANASLRVEDVGVHSVPFYDPFDYQKVVGDNLVVGLAGGLAYDTRDSYLRPTSGRRIDASYEQVTGDFNFPILNLGYSEYFTTYQRADGSGKHVLAFNSRASLAGSQAPVFERFFAGGYSSMRGFQFRGISPEVNGIKVGGDFLLLNSLEYQIPVKANDSIYFVGFVDSGTVESRMEIKDYRVSAGVGVRFVVPMLGPVPIALDLGFPVVKGPGDREQVFSFSLGITR